MHGRPLLLLLVLLLLPVIEPRLLLLIELVMVLLRCFASGWMCRGVLFGTGRKLMRRVDRDKFTAHCQRMPQL